MTNIETIVEVAVMELKNANSQGVEPVDDTETLLKLRSKDMICEGDFQTGILAAKLIKVTRQGMKAELS